MNSQQENTNNLSMNNLNKIHNITNSSIKNEKKTEEKEFLPKEKLIFGSYKKNNYEIINLKLNKIQNFQTNENNNNSIFIFNKNDDIDKIYSTENNSGLSLIKIMEEKGKDKKKIKEKRNLHQLIL